MATSSLAEAQSRTPPAQSQNGSYILRKLISDVPLSGDGQATDIRITCVEVWNGNLYIGTSAAEILHFVLIPPEPTDLSGEPTFILASRLQPAYTHENAAGVQQILVLSRVNKACIVCNNTLTFYSLPELSPAFPSTKPLPCLWVGGVDQNEDDEGMSAEDGVVIMICQSKRIRLARVTEDGPRSVRSIEFGGSLATARRDAYACVADSRSYALLDVEHAQKIPLFPISSLDEEAAGAVGGASEELPTGTSSQPLSRSASSASAHPRTDPRDDRGHSRSTSLGIFGGLGQQQRQESPRPVSSQRYGFDVPEALQRFQTATSPERRSERSVSPMPRRTISPDKPLPPAPAQADMPPPKPQQKRAFVPLKPHIVSPTPSEFLLTTGTAPSEPGVGMFVNLDGDVVRGTLEFSSYPQALVVDGRGVDSTATPVSGQMPEEGYILAVMQRYADDNIHTGVEIQRWDADPGEGAASREWLNLEALPGGVGDSSSSSLGIRAVVTPSEIILPDISEKLSVKRLNLNKLRSDSPSRAGSESPSQIKAQKQDAEFANRLSKLQARILLWCDSQIWWVTRNPLIIRLDAQLDLAKVASTQEGGEPEPDREQIEHLLESIRGLEPRTEAEFLGLNYIRQKASVLLFMELVSRTAAGFIVFEHDKKATEEALVEGEVDPRVILALLPLLREEVVQGQNGIWVQGGLKALVEDFIQKHDLDNMSLDPAGPFGDNLLQLVKRYLFVWRRKKGFGSVADEKEVSQTVDAALLRLLLLLDSRSPPGPATAKSIRAELNSVVDSSVDCFDRAIVLLEDFNRLYVLSRLYQSRKMSAKVLDTWRRIVNGEADLGGELTDGEQEVRKYLSKISNKAIVEEYGAWLANRNPKLGVQVFADELAKAKFTPNEAVALLKEKAPGAVKEYLEYLIFGKKQPHYANDLISFYLDIVITELETSPDSKDLLLSTYSTYRALSPPKPTYRQFITDNGLPDEWWTSRLRLLQLLGSNQGSAAASYDVSSIVSRLAPFEQELVPEMIILNGRQDRHEEAIRLLTHGLGDFDTAISYCLLGGSSIFRPLDGFIPQEAVPSREEQARLFGFLLSEFLRIEDVSERIDRTGQLLERFGGWFDVAEVLAMIPDSWSIDIFSEFLVSALRRLVAEKSESTIAKALTGAVNLRASADVIEKAEEVGSTVERVK